MITAADIRRRYVEFFAERGHKVVASAPLVPPDDPTLFFTTAGMVQFKSLYTGEMELPYARAVSVQKCLRAGGKGSDLENVGRTLRHHTFFEMLGNFSFGDYFKKEAIEWAWEFCTGKDWLGLPPERIWPTVFGKKDERGEWVVDEDAERFWKENTGVVNPVFRLDESENFWGPAGGTGACGPCSEIKFFMGSDAELKQYQELAHSGGEGLEKAIRDSVEEGDLFLEIWNLVFPQYNQQTDGTRPALKNRGIDTGAGLERMTTACRMIESGGKVWSPYETDLLEPIVEAVATRASLPYPRLRGGEAAEEKLRAAGRDPAAVRLAMNACADHARTLAFALAEGIVPSNEGHGYVIRRILRRAARFGKKIGIEDPFLYTLIDPVIEAMGEAYPELKIHPAQIRKSIRLEEERFNRTLHLGSEMLEQMLEGRAKGDRLTGAEAYRLYDTYGFPFDLASEIAEERGLQVDAEGFAQALGEAKKLARAAWKGRGGTDLGEYVKDLREKPGGCEFTGYTEIESVATITALVRGEQRVETLEEGQAGIVVLDRTPFYGEGGGQIGDSGVLTDANGSTLFNVEDTQKTDDGYVFHFGEAETRFEVGQVVTARIDAERRDATMKNHSVTHLLQGALKRIIGSHVTQSGSYVGPDHLRFDFTNPEPIDAESLGRIEKRVNEQIQRNLEVTTQVMALEEARATGAIAPFGEKYGHSVRVVKMGEYSTEFCGGTHVASTGEIGAFIITSESSVASGIRRIEAMTGPGAITEIGRDRTILAQLSRSLSVPADRLPERVAALQAEIKEIKRAQRKQKTEQAKSAEMPIVHIGDASACIAWIEGADVNRLRTTVDELRAKHNDRKFVTVLGSGSNGKATLIIGATSDLEGTPLEAGKLIGVLAPLFGGRGGGKPRLAQAGGNDAGKLKALLEGDEVSKRLREILGAA